MSPERWRHIKAIFNSAVDLSPEECARFLNEKCAHDPELQREVESLLASEQNPGSILDRPVMNAAAVAALAPAPARDPNFMGGRTIGNYTISGVLASGGMGTVYRARHVTLPREVVVKCIRRVALSGEGQAELRTRFRREAHIQCQLDHPRIVRVYEFLTEGEDCFLVMEYVPGASLRSTLDEKGALPPDQVAALAVQALDGLAHAHALHYVDELGLPGIGIVHRDIKPANLLVDRNGNLKLTDFGIAKELGEDKLTRTGMSIGTLDYMSPEQLRGLPVDARSDLYSLGVTLYEILTGRLPDQGPASVRSVRPDVPSGLARAVERALEADPDRRWQSAAEFRDAILAGGRPWLRVPDALTRRPRLVVAALAVLLVLSAAFYGFRALRGGRHVLQLYVVDTQGHPLSGVRLTVRSEGGAAETREGKVRIPISASTPANSWLTLGILNPSDLVFISPWDERVRVPAAGDESQNYTLVVVSERGHRVLLENPDALRAMAERANDSLSPRKLGQEKAPDQGTVVAQVAGAFGLQASEVDQAIRGWGDKSKDRYDSGVSALYARDYPAATQNLGAFVEERKHSPKDAANRVGAASLSLGQALYQQGKFQQAASAYEVANEFRPGDPELLNAWGVSLYRAAQYKDAERVFREALAIREKLLGPEHPGVATTLNDLGVVLHVDGDNRQAEQLYRRALAIREKRLGPEHPDVAETLSNLGVVLRAGGKLAEAEKVLRRALSIDEKVLPANHPDVAANLNALAALLASKGDYATAEPLYRRALAIREDSLGPNHPDTAISLNNLATLLRAKGDYAEAERLFRHALEIKEKELGPDHPSVSTGLSNLAALLKAKGDYAEADRLYRRALGIREKELGPLHPSMPSSLTNLGTLLVAKGDYNGAEPLLRRALAIDEKSKAPANLARTLDGLGELMAAKRDYSTAESYYRRALALNSPAIPSEVVARLNNNLGDLLRLKHDYAGAEPLLRRGLEIREKTLGAAHPDIAESLATLGDLFRDRGDFPAAQAAWRRALEIDEKTLGAANVKTRSLQSSLQKLALAHKS